MKISVVRHSAEARVEKSLLTELNREAANAPDADVYVFCNHKIQGLDEGLLDLLAQKALEDGVGAVSPLILSPKKVVLHAGIIFGRAGEVVKLFDGVKADFEHLRLGPPTIEREVSAVSLQCLAIARSKFEEIGQFNEDFLGPLAALDLCLRLESVGLPARVLGGIEVTLSNPSSPSPPANDQELLELSLSQYHQGKSDVHFPDDLEAASTQIRYRKRLRFLPGPNLREKLSARWRHGRALLRQGFLTRLSEVQSERRHLGVARHSLHYRLPPFIKMRARPLNESFRNYFVPGLSTEYPQSKLLEQILSDANDGVFVRLILLDDSPVTDCRLLFGEAAWEKVSHRVSAVSVAYRDEFKLDISPYDTFVSCEWRGRTILQQNAVPPSQCTHYLFDDERAFFDADDEIESELREMVQESLQLPKTHIKVASKSLADSLKEDHLFESWKMLSYEVFERPHDTQSLNESENLQKEKILLLDFEAGNHGSRFDLAVESLYALIDQVSPEWTFACFGLEQDIVLKGTRKIKGLGKLNPAQRRPHYQKSPLGLYLRESARPNARALEHIECGALAICNSYGALDPAQCSAALVAVPLKIEKITETLLKSLSLVDAALKKPYAPDLSN